MISISWQTYLADQVWQNLPASSMKTKIKGEIHCRCPLCGDSRKNKYKRRGFYYITTGIYYCFNCGASMSGMHFLKEICDPLAYKDICDHYKQELFSQLKNGSSNATVLDELNEDPSAKFNFDGRKPAYQILMDKFNWNNPTPLTTEAREYLSSRMIPPSQHKIFQSITDPDGKEFILIPYRYNGTCIYYQLNNFKKYKQNGEIKKYIFPKNEDLEEINKPVFNIDNVDVTWRYIICCEGVYDSLFFKNGVSLGGRSLTPYQAEMLQTRFPNHKIVLAFDNDIAGKTSMLKFAKENSQYLFLNTFRLLDTANAKDINEFVINSGRSDVFSNKKILESLMQSAFKVQMGLKVGSDILSNTP